MDYKKILELLNKKNVIKVKLIIIDGNEIIITKKDILEKDEGNLVIRRDTEHIAIPLDEIGFILSIQNLFFGFAVVKKLVVGTRRKGKAHHGHTPQHE